MPVVPRQEHDLALLHRNLRRAAILDDVEHDVAPQLVEKLLVRVVVVVGALVRPAHDLHDQVVGGWKDELVADRRLKQVAVLVDPAREVECGHRHCEPSERTSRGIMNVAAHRLACESPCAALPAILPLRRARLRRARCSRAGWKRCATAGRMTAASITTAAPLSGIAGSRSSISRAASSRSPRPTATS